MTKNMRERVRLGMAPLGYQPPDRVYTPNSCSLAPDGFKEAVCRAAAWDAGTRSMKANGRTVWNEDDFNAAAREYEQLIF